MKSKFLAVAILSVILYSCASKTVAPETPVVVKEEVKPAVAPLTAELAAGKTLYENNCAKCHKLFEPTDFSQKDWQPILVRMQKKAHLDDTQMAGINNYIYSQLK